MPDGNPPPRTQAKSAGRALDILELLGREPGGLTFTDIVNQLNFPKSSLHELLGLLVERRFLMHDAESRRYSLGIKVWEVGQAYVRHSHIVDVAMPEMEKVVASINETMQLAILDRMENVYLAKVDCTHPLRIQTDVGKRFPSYATALGKVLLASLPPDEAVRRLSVTELKPLTACTILDEEEFLLTLAATRTHGFGVDWEEGMDGLRCVAVPVRDHTGVVAALSMSVPVTRATSNQMAVGIQLLANASLAISRSLGAMEEDPGVSRILSMPQDNLRRLYEEAERIPRDQ